MNTYVILAAGSGKRLWPLTESYPKPLVRVMGKSLLEWLIEGLLPTAQKIILVVGFGKEKIIRELSSRIYASKLVFVEQDQPRGTGHALLQAEPHVEGDAVVFNGDNFYGAGAFTQVAEAAARDPFFAFAYPVPDQRNYGIFQVHNGMLAGLEEKPEQAKPGLANLNLFKVPKAFFALLNELKPSPRGELEVTDALLEFAKKNEVPVHELNTYWTDVGYFWNYLEANAYAAKHLSQPRVLGEVEPGVVMKGQVFIGEGTVVKNGTRIEGPVWVGQNCSIGPNAFLRAGSVVEDGVHVGSSEIKASVLMRGSRVPHYSYVGDSVLGEDVNLGAGAKLANLRFDDQSVKIFVNGKSADSNLRKLGSCIGAGAKIGINTSIHPGILIGSQARVWPGVVVNRNVESDTDYKGTLEPVPFTSGD